MDDPDPLSSLARPDPSSSHAGRTREWIEWFGIARLITTAVAVVIVCAGAWWLVRSPQPPPETGLPRVAATTSVVAATSVPGGSSVAVDPTPVGSTAAADQPAVLVVHVTGAVARRGVYEFDPGARLSDAIDRAGGATLVGRPHELNLAAPLTDGMRVVVPVEGEVVDPDLRRDAATTDDAPLESPDVGIVDVNTADLSELETLPGVGPATALAIITDRDRNGPFVAVDDLVRVPGIGPAKLEQLRPAVTT